MNSVDVCVGMGNKAAFCVIPAVKHVNSVYVSVL